VGSFVYGHEPLGSIKCGEFLDQLRDYQFFKDTAPLNLIACNAEIYAMHIGTDNTFYFIHHISKLQHLYHILHAAHFHYRQIKFMTQCNFKCTKHSTSGI
jgi:hypothetical protein